jgi:hypothetical protein
VRKQPSRAFFFVHPAPSSRVGDQGPGCTAAAGRAPTTRARVSYAPTSAAATDSVHRNPPPFSYLLLSLLAGLVNQLKSPSHPLEKPFRASSDPLPPTGSANGPPARRGRARMTDRSGGERGGGRCRGWRGGRAHGAAWCCGSGRRSAPASWDPRSDSPTTPPSGKPHDHRAAAPVVLNMCGFRF